MKKILILIIIGLIAVSCDRQVRKNNVMNIGRDFNQSLLRTDMQPAKTVSGQLLYLPIYSNIPFQFDTIMYDMSAFVAVHNTDLRSNIRLTKVLYFNQSGKLVDDFLKNGDLILMPLVTKEFYIPYEDKSGTGANFLIEWVSDTLVNEPLVESITLSLLTNNKIAILSQGKIIKERR